MRKQKKSFSPNMIIGINGASNELKAKKKEDPFRTYLSSWTVIGQVNCPDSDLG